MLSLSGCATWNWIADFGSACMELGDAGKRVSTGPGVSLFGEPGTDGTLKPRTRCGLKWRGIRYCDTGNAAPRFIRHDADAFVRCLSQA